MYKAELRNNLRGPTMGRSMSYGAGSLRRRIPKVGRAKKKHWKTRSGLAMFATNLSEGFLRKLFFVSLLLWPIMLIAAKCVCSWWWIFWQWIAAWKFRSSVSASGASGAVEAPSVVPGPWYWSGDTLVEGGDRTSSYLRFCCPLFSSKFPFLGEKKNLEFPKNHKDDRLSSWQFRCFSCWSRLFSEAIFSTHKHRGWESEGPWDGFFHRRWVVVTGEGLGKFHFRTSDLEIIVQYETKKQRFPGISKCFFSVSCKLWYIFVKNSHHIMLLVLAIQSMFWSRRLFRCGMCRTSKWFCSLDSKGLTWVSSKSRSKKVCLKLVM